MNSMLSFHSIYRRFGISCAECELVMNQLGDFITSDHTLIGAEALLEVGFWSSYKLLSGLSLLIVCNKLNRSCGWNSIDVTLKMLTQKFILLLMFVLPFADNLKIESWTWSKQLIEIKAPNLQVCCTFGSFLTKLYPGLLPARELWQFCSAQLPFLGCR